MLISFFGLFSISTVQADTFDDLIQQLTTVKLSKTKAVLEQLSETKNEYLLPLFETMLEGNLYYEKSSKVLLSVVKTDGEDVITNLLTGEQLSIEKKAASKIKVNNSLRVYLRSAIAKIQLTSDNVDERYDAVRDLYKKLDKAVIATITELRETESNPKVAKAMDIAIAMDRAKNGTDEWLRIEAIQLLASSLEPTVRNVLMDLADQVEAPNIAIEANIALNAIEGKIGFYNKVDTLFFGLSLGSVLLLASIGLAITFGVMGVINMAHGEMIMLGAYTTYVVQLIMPNYIDYSIWVAIPAAFLVSGLMGVIIERSVIQFLHGRPLETLLATFGISLILQQLVRTIFSPLNRQVNTPTWMSGSIELNPVLFLTLNRFYIFIFALLVFAALVIILNKTNLGLHVRAVSQNRNMAKAMGIKTAKVDALTFGLGSGIAGIAGVALSQLTNVGPNLGQGYIIDSFMVVVFGGVGNLFGTLVAAFTLGIANKVFEPITGAVLASILVLVFIILFIQKRPKGLFPQKGRAAE
jgi:urea transport system permease protein